MMGLLTKIIILIVAAEHLFFLILEMFLWQTKIGLRVFKMSKEVARTTSKLASNQGLYNGFLSAGLFWALFLNSQEIATFFLICVSIAGIFGGITVNPVITIVQTMPALLGLVSLWLVNL